MVTKEELFDGEYAIPEGYTASIENGKIIVKKEESEDEKIRKEILEYFQQFENEELRGVNISDWIAWLEKQGKKNMGISEATKQKLKEYLKKALEKETPELWNEFLDKQKPTWSEEDKENLLDVKCIIDKVWHSKDFREDTYYSVEELESLWSWLDDIWQRLEYPQDTWKPSDEQMKELKLAANIYPDSRLGHALKSLYQDLMTYQNNLKL